jgi:putative membrane protein
MNRRNAVALLAMSIAAPSVAFAATMGDAEKEHAEQTLAVGSVALETSRAAQSKITGAWVKKFASYEIAEQTTIADILKSMGAAPPKMTEKQMAMIAKAKDGKAGADFDKTYVADQIEGHKELLKIQETYIGKGKDAGTVGLAKLARAQIKEHIDILETIQKDMKS